MNDPFLWRWHSTEAAHICHTGLAFIRDFLFNPFTKARSQRSNGTKAVLDSVVWLALALFIFFFCLRHFPLIQFFDKLVLLKMRWKHYSIEFWAVLGIVQHIQWFRIVTLLREIEWFAKFLFKKTEKLNCEVECTHLICADNVLTRD